jgi:hypothetical protein
VSDDAAAGCTTFLSKTSTKTFNTWERAKSGAAAALGMETSEVPGRYRASVCTWRYPWCTDTLPRRATAGLWSKHTLENELSMAGAGEGSARRGFASRRSERSTWDGEPETGHENKLAAREGAGAASRRVTSNGLDKGMDKGSTTAWGFRAEATLACDADPASAGCHGGHQVRLWSQQYTPASYRGKGGTGEEVGGGCGVVLGAYVHVQIWSCRCP